MGNSVWSACREGVSRRRAVSRPPPNSRLTADDKCCICLDPLISTDGTKRKQPLCYMRCGHSVHFTCCQQLVRQSQNERMTSPPRCPICRDHMFDDGQDDDGISQTGGNEEEELSLGDLLLWYGNISIGQLLHQVEENDDQTTFETDEDDGIVLRMNNDSQEDEAGSNDDRLAQLEMRLNRLGIVASTDSSLVSSNDGFEQEQNANGLDRLRQDGTSAQEVSEDTFQVSERRLPSPIPWASGSLESRLARLRTDDTSGRSTSSDDTGRTSYSTANQHVLYEDDTILICNRDSPIFHESDNSGSSSAVARVEMAAEASINDMQLSYLELRLSRL